MFLEAVTKSAKKEESVYIRDWLRAFTSNYRLSIREPASFDPEVYRFIGKKAFIVEPGSVNFECPLSPDMEVLVGSVFRNLMHYVPLTRLGKGNKVDPL